MSWEQAYHPHPALFSRMFPHQFQMQSSVSAQSAPSDPHHGLDAMMTPPSGYTTPLMQSPAYPNACFDPAMLTQSENRTDEEKKQRGKNILRRYKTPSPQVLRHRRCAANERERRRMTTLNTAYDKLRTVLPECDSGRRLSKYDTLRMAQEYIAHLNTILKANNK